MSKSIKIAFHCDQLSLRGVEVATFNYAKYNEELLGNQSVIITKSNAIYSDSRAISKFEKRFEVFYYSSLQELEDILKCNKVNLLYAQKDGLDDGVVSINVDTFVHVVFQRHQPHGTYYYYISEWLAEKMCNDRKRSLPYIVDLKRHTENLKNELRIPKDAVVFGRYGGFETFDLFFVKLSIFFEAKKNPSSYFVFMNTDNFVNSNFLKVLKELFKSSYGKKVRVLNFILFFIRKFLFYNQKFLNIIFLDGTSDEFRKVAFINTCDAMIHARKQGETFGLACAEFSFMNKPVITYGKSHEMAHSDMLQEKQLVYMNRRDLSSIFSWIGQGKHKHKNWDAFSKSYSPQAVMEKWSRLILANRE